MGNDVIFGSDGQNDIIGGSSNLFGQTTVLQRESTTSGADGSNLIFGGSGTYISRETCGPNGADANNNCMVSASGRTANTDVIVAANGDIFDLVGLNG